MFFSLVEYAAQNNVTRQTAASWLAQNDIAYIKPGGKYSIPDTADYMKGLLETRKDMIANGSDGLKSVVVSVINHKGGVGKSTAVSNISASLAFYGLRVLVVDADPQANTSNIGKMKHLHGNFKDANLLKLLNNMEKYDSDAQLREKVLETIVSVDAMKELCHTGGKLDLLPNSLDWAESVEPLLFKANSANYLDILLSTVKDEYDIIIIDTAPSLDILWKQAVIASDTLLIALKLEEDSVDGLIGVIRATYKLNSTYRDRKKRNIEILGAIVVDYSANANYSKKQEPALLSVLDNELIHNREPGILFEPRISKTFKVPEIQNKTRIALHDEPTNNLTDEFLQLSTRILYDIYRTRGIG